jgi:hypothetical protein
MIKGVAFVGVLATLLACAPHAYGQTPTGSLTGTVIDATGASVSGAQVTVANAGTRQLREQTTNEAGLFTAAALPPGLYHVTIRVAGFKRIERDVVVEAGTSDSIQVRLELGDVAETITVERTPTAIRRSQHQVGSVVTREQIDAIPLNGRSFLELAKLEPGVTPSRLSDGRTFVSFLGAGLQTVPRIGFTRVTVDGVNITTPGTAGVLLQVSPDVVQEFQIASVNFDVATSLTSNGAINIVTRSGTNEAHGNGFYVFRNDDLAAYPGLRRDPLNPRPEFARHQSGASFGGPLWKDRVFFFGSFERTSQRAIVAVQPLEEFASLGGLYRSPYAGNQGNLRVDLPFRNGDALFVRYTLDHNALFSNLGLGNLPSSWSQRITDGKQVVSGMTSVISNHTVNEMRVSHFQVNTPFRPATAELCPGCFGLGEIRTIVSGADLVYGGTGPLTDGAARSIQLADTVTWQLGRHTLRGGGEWEATKTMSLSPGVQAGEITLFTPREARQTLPGIPLPAQFATPADILTLPLKQFSITVGSGTVFWKGFRPDRITDLHRFHVSDTWRTTDRLAINVGLAWSYEPNAIAQDLTKPSLLAPLVGADGLKPPEAGKRNFSTALGAAWVATADGKTVVRAGAGRYFDPLGSTNSANRIRERDLLSPLGTGTLTETGANLIVDGQRLQFQQPTYFRGADLIALIPAIRESLLQSLNPANRDLSVRNVDLLKRGNNFVDPSYTTPSSVHVSVGVQRELGRGFVVSADVAWKRFRNTFINGIDYNRWNSVGGPVLPACTGVQRLDVRAVCSNGPIFFDTTFGRARYRGLLVRAEKRFSGRAQLLASYAFSSFVGTNSTGTGSTENPGGRVFGFNNDNWLENYGPLPTDQPHILNVSGTIRLPLDLTLAISLSASSAPPFAPYVGNIDFNGDGTVNDLLPGTTINQFGRDRDKADLVRLVERYNSQIAGRPTPRGPLAPVLQLPSSFSFNDSFFTQDMRVTRRVKLGSARQRAALILDVFNLFNTSNVISVASDLTQPSSFGQASERVGQLFGSGGSRAVQIGLRFDF